MNSVENGGLRIKSNVASDCNRARPESAPRPSVLKDRSTQLLVPSVFLVLRGFHVTRIATAAATVIVHSATAHGHSSHGAALHVA